MLSSVTAYEQLFAVTENETAINVVARQETTEDPMVTWLDMVFWDGKPEPLIDEALNQSGSMTGQILIPVGLALIIAGWVFSATRDVTQWFIWTGLGLVPIPLGLYIWGLLEWSAARMETTMETTYRSWKINQMSLWASVILAASTLVLVWFKPSYCSGEKGWGSVLCDMLTLFTVVGFLGNYGSMIFGGIGSIILLVGAYLVWDIKGIWYNNDPEGSMRDSEFNYFGF